MKAIRVHEYGGAAVLKLEDAPDPKAGPGEMVVRGRAARDPRGGRGESAGRVRAAGVNPVDAYIATGTYPRKPPLPYSPGQDGAGEVVAAGSGVRESKAGDRAHTCAVGH